MQQTEEKKRHLRVDMHTHILPKQWPDLAKKYGYSGWVQLDHFEEGKARMMRDGKCFREIECNCWSPSQRIAECDSSTIDVQVLSTVPVMFNYWAKPKDTLDLARYLNDHIAQVVAEDPKRFVGLGTLPMQDPELAVQELHRCVNELGLAGVQIGSHVNEWNLDAPELDPIFAAAEELNTAIFVHPWDMDTKSRMEKYWFPWLIGMPCETTMAICSVTFGGVLDRYPKLKIGFAHGGGSFPGTLGRIEHGFHARPDLCAVKTKRSPMSYLDQIWIDSLVHDEATLEFVIKKMGIDRIMLGTDYPFPLGELEPGKLVDESKWLCEEDKAKILGLNVCKFLNMDPEFYLKM
ncbi:hypothetical protein K7432_013982 [Basidiobolus ranarum]|uniref:2-amino-3-carboxymuconate-6-semialdehyde decarboxylase n=1 Tax=Basidiobolus ranarum TaxID=34480 RepID=A0ABR2VQ29_9FUNG